MNPSKLLRRWLDHGTRPSSQREASALLDESRSLLVSKLPTTGEIMNTFTAADLDSINPKGGNVLDQMHAAYLKKQNFKPSSTPSTMKVFTSPRKTSAPPTAKPAARPAPKPAPTAAASKPAPTIHRASAKNLSGMAKVSAAFAAKATAPAPQPKTKPISADEFKIKRPEMLRSEWQKLSMRDKKRFADQYGKII